eukprot:TRINITY_DN1869_c0_g1_i12.p1 TRINITY_DN1869_c0_g1~~TRINITY_DN1869_c0_g1_i12.p1  ORF type:complete len:298 (-),score=74.69 TRINITY_DN1869_c0_g1_i12:11-904(-)
MSRTLAFRSLWGCELFSTNIKTLASELKRLGYVGIEASLGDLGALAKDRTKLNLYQNTLKEHDLKLICGVYTSWQDYEGQPEYKSVKEQLQQYREQLKLASSLEPHHVNVHSGSDTWTEQQNQEFFADAVKIEQDSGLSVSHETHRGRSFFQPFQTHRLLQQFDLLRITADLSHWVVVTERLLDSPFEARVLSECCQRASHIHARIGYPQHAQISHLQNPEHAEARARHEDWWRLIIESHRARGAGSVSFTPEYGPPPYQQTLPFTGAPVSDLWQLTNAAKSSFESLFDRIVHNSNK